MRGRIVSLGFFCVLVSACGGGGGGGDSGGTTTPTTSTPTAPPFALTATNAVDAITYALGPLEQMVVAQQTVISGALYLRQTGRTQYSGSCTSTGAPPVAVTLSLTDRDASGGPTAGDVVTVENAECNGLRRRISLTISRATPGLDQIEGRVDLDISVDPPAMQVVGSFDVAMTASIATSETTWRTTNAVVAVTKASTTQTVRIATSQFVVTPTNYTHSIAGGSVESAYLGGSYSFATVAPLTGTARRLPTAGELMLTAPAGSRVRVRPPTTPGTEDTVEYAIAASSSGDFGAVQQDVWTTLIRGWIFGWRPNERPIISSLTIQPSNPSPGASLWVYYGANDPNGDALTQTIEWKQNGTIVGNQQYLSIATARNDQISVTVTVSDGVLTATATASVTIGNPAPQLTLTLTPAEPDTTVDLVAVPTIHEPDGDPVTTTYQWFRNGNSAPITGRTTATLPASETTRGDTYTVRVTVSDGTSTVEASASSTIVDSPPRVTVVSPPTTVTHGAPVTFTATVSDADGDPINQLDFVLAYGPAGMTVDADTGVASWTAAGPMFDRTMNVNWGIGVNSPTVQLATGTLEITDPTRNYPLLRFGMQIPTWPSGLSVADLDGDGDTEMMIMSRRSLFELEADGAGGYKQAWAYPFPLNVSTEYSYNPHLTSLTTVDVDGDDHHEIFAAAGRTITKLDGATRRAIATRQLTSMHEACTDLAHADLQNDGTAELICLATTDTWANTARIVILRSGDLSTVHEFPANAYGRSFAIGNVDTDAALEIVTAAGYVFDGATFTNQWLYSPGFGMDVDTGDLDGDGVEEIVAAADWSFVRGFTTRGPVTNPVSPIWEVPHFDLDSLLVTNVGGDARPEIIVGDGQWGNVTLYRYNTATNGLDILDQMNSQDHGVTSIGVGDVDHDGNLEFIWGSGMSSSGADVLVVAGRNPTLAAEWMNGGPAQLDGPFRGGALAGSPLTPRAPLFLTLETNSGYDGSRLVRMPANGGPLQVSTELGSNWSGTGALDVVDYDSDGTDEAFVATNVLYDGGFTVYDFFAPATEWTSPLSSHQATQDVTHADITGDGRAELIGLTGGVVYVHNVYQQSLVWQSTTLNGAYRVLVANMDSDASTLEIVVVASQAVYVYQRTAPPVLYVQSATYQTTRSIVDADVADVDGDGAMEVVLLQADMYSYSNASEIVTLSAGLQPEPVGSFALPWRAQTLDIEPSAAPRKNLIVSRVVGESADGSIVIIGSRSGGVVLESPVLSGIVQRDSIHYVTLPGETRQRFSIGTSAGMYLTR